MSYAIYRGEGIKTLQELSQKGSHNERTKEKYKSNPNIRVEDSKNNIEIIKCNKYVDKFYEMTKEYQKEHYDRMKNMRADRKKSFHDMVNDSKSVVADEMIFTSDIDFFKNMSKDELMKWANETMNFVYEDLGYTKEQVLHAVIHMDEKVPHLHCVVVPLVKKFDKRTDTIKYTISK
jgi:deoxyadenosine/deoxycytidine kinase